MLPLEILTLVLLACTAAAIPQPQKGSPINATAPAITTPPETVNAPEFVHEESTATGFGDDDPKKIHAESTADGLGTKPGDPHKEIPSPTSITTTQYIPSNVQSQVFVTNSIVFIHTEVAASVTKFDPNNGPEPTPGVNGGDGGTPSGNNDEQPVGGNSPTAGGNPGSPQATSGGELLSEIISKLGPTNQGNPAVATQNGDATPAITGSPQTAAPALTMEQSITLGPEILTLTPGLSTTVGTGSTATMVELTTNSLGQTIIVISSSGTAVSATVTTGPVTVTSARTGFDAATTAGATPKITSHLSSSPGAAATTTSRKGEAIGRWRSASQWWIGSFISIFGIMIIL